MSRRNLWPTQISVPIWLWAVIAVLGLIGLLAVIYRDDIFSTIQDPGQPFQTYAPPAAPEYARADDWLALPDLSTDPYEVEGAADIFVVVPSVYRGGKHWNLPIDDEKRKSKLQRIIRPNYVGPYRDLGRVFAPYYRQASLYAYLTAREDAQEAQDLAYGDVKTAFEFFLEQSPPERPIILVGHNQGASHVQRLLAEYFAGDLKNRLAVAYAVDYPLPLSHFDQQLSNILPCSTPQQTKCVAAFGTFTPSDSVIADRFANHLLVHDGRKYVSVRGEDMLCVNPLVWTTAGDYVPARLHKGGVAAEGLEPDLEPAILARQVGAECQDGLLLVDKPKSGALRRPWQIGAKFRTLPSNLFYEDMRQNAALRVGEILAAGILPKRTKKLDGFDVIEVEEAPITPVDE